MPRNIKIMSTLMVGALFTSVVTPFMALAGDDAVAKGKVVYDEYCSSCHQATGSGVPFQQPPLKGSAKVLGDKSALIKFLEVGTVNSVEFSDWNNIMPAFDFLSAAEKANVLTYIRQAFENKASAVSEKDVVDALKK